MLLRQLKLKQKNKEGHFFGTLLGKLGASLLANICSRKFEIQKYYQNEKRFEGISSKNSFEKYCKRWVYVMNVE